MEITSAEVRLFPPTGSTGTAGTVDTAFALVGDVSGTGSFAGATDPDSHTEILGAIYTDIFSDSSTAVFTLATVGANVPAPLVEKTQIQGGTAYTTGEHITLESSLFVLSTTKEASDDYEEYITFVYEEDSEVVRDIVIDPPVETWTIDVLPSAGEALGTPAKIEIDAVISGIMETEGPASATARWSVKVNEATEIITGTAQASGLMYFGETSDHDFVIRLGDSFQLSFLWELSLTATNVSAAGAEFTEGSIQISARILPEPSTPVLLVVALFSIIPLRLTSR